MADEPRTDIGWIAKKYQLRLLVESYTAPTNDGPLKSRSPDERMTARLAALTLIVVLAFAAKAIPTGASGSTAVAAAVSGAVATAIAWALEKLFRHWTPIRRDTVQLSFYGALAAVLFVYVVVDTLFGRWFPSLELNRQFSGAVVASLVALLVLAGKIWLYDTRKYDFVPTPITVLHLVAVVGSSGLLTWLIAAVPDSAFAGVLEFIGLFGSSET